MTFAASHPQAAETSRFPAFNGGLRDLFSTLDDLLTCGGDPRLMLDPVSRLNDYGCGPSPLPQTLSFASSTASTISERAYERAGLAREELMRSAIAVGLESALETRIEDMRAELKAHLALPPAKVDVVFSASGTDSQLHALYLARLLLGPDLKTIVVGSDQTGSGTPFTARGRHFNRFTASGMTVRKDTPVAGLACDSVMVPIADASGLRLRADADLAVLDAVEAAVAGGSRVLLHVMDASKFGWRAPSQGCLDAIAQHWGDKVLVVVDACQMRLGRRRLRFLLDRGCMVLVTGSKFFGGPAFSGALLVPSSLSSALDGNQEIAPGIFGLCQSQRLACGVDRSAIALREPVQPRSMVALGSRARGNRSLLRGAGCIPRKGAARLSHRHRKPHLIVAVASPGRSRPPRRTMMSFPRPRSFHSRFITTAACCPRMIAACCITCSPRTSAASSTASEADRDLIARRCLIGQPVRIERLKAPTAALRLCVGARLVTEAWSPDAEVARQNLQDQTRSPSPKSSPRSNSCSRSTGDRE